MLKLAFAATIFAVSANAADFRALNIGQSCVSVRESEIAQGSTPLPARTGEASEILVGEYFWLSHLHI